MWWMQIDHFNGEHMKDMISWRRCHVTFHIHIYLPDNLTIDRTFTWSADMFLYIGIIFTYLHISKHSNWIIIVCHFKCLCFFPDVNANCFELQCSFMAKWNWINEERLDLIVHTWITYKVGRYFLLYIK